MDSNTYKLRQQKENRQVALWLMTVYAMIFIMVSVGGITRLTRSGLSIVEWRPITGVLPPTSEQEWQAEFDKYRQFPEYQKVNKGMSLDQFKFIFFWEFIHRLFGRLIGLVFFVPFVYFWARGKLKHDRLLLRSSGAFILGGLQGLMGWYMVKSGLVNEPRVSHFRLAAHLLLAFGIMMYLLYMALELFDRSKEKPPEPYTAPQWLRRILPWFAALVVIQVMYGAFTAGLRAGYTYNTFPLMGGSLYPPGMLEGHTSALAALVESIPAVQFIHRTLGWILLLGAALLWYRLRSCARPVSRAAGLLAASIVLQFLLGVFTLLFAVPVALGVIHQAGAMIVLSLLILLIYTVRHSVKQNADRFDGKSAD